MPGSPQMRQATPGRAVLTEAHLLRRYGEELGKRRQEEVGLS